MNVIRKRKKQKVPKNTSTEGNQCEWTPMAHQYLLYDTIENIAYWIFITSSGKWRLSVQSSIWFKWTCGKQKNKHDQQSLHAPLSLGNK